MLGTKIEPIRPPHVRFIDVPIGAIFSFLNKGRYLKIRQPLRNELNMPPNRMEPDAINLSNNHEVCIGCLACCEVLDENSDVEVYDEEKGQEV